MLTDNSKTCSEKKFTDIEEFSLILKKVTSQPFKLFERNISTFVRISNRMKVRSHIYSKTL